MLAGTPWGQQEVTTGMDKAVANYVANQKAKGAPVNVPPPGATGAAPGTTGAVGDSGGGKGLPAQPEKASNAHSPPKK